MTLEELKKGEHETVEYKQDIPAEKEKYLKTAVAFANAAGGQIIFGVQNQTWDVIGFSDDEVFQRMDAITNSIFDACEPAVVPIMSIEEMDDLHQIVHAIDVDVVDNGSLADVLTGYNKSLILFLAGTNGNGKGTADG